MHEQLAKYVLHTHSTALTILSSVGETPKLAKDWLGPECLLMEYLDPGILLGIEAKKLLEGYGEIPKRIMQRNHGVFYALDDFDNLIKMHNSVIKGIQERINWWVRRKGLDEWPYGSIAVNFEKVTGLIRAPKMMKALYQTVFGKPAERANYTYTSFEGFPVHKIENRVDGRVDGVIYFYDSGLAREYAKSYRPCTRKLSWLTPDHIVSMGKHTDYITFSDPTDINKCEQEIAEQVKPHEEGIHARVYVIAGLGIATIGGYIPSDKEPEVKARYAMQFVNDALLVHQGVCAIGILRMLTEKNVDFIANWEVEKARAQVFQDKG